MHQHRLDQEERRETEGIRKRIKGMDKYNMKEREMILFCYIHAFNARKLITL
jgi:hypothetical protein